MVRKRGIKMIPLSSQPYLTSALLGISLAFIVIGGFSFYTEATAIQRENEISIVALTLRNEETVRRFIRPFENIPPSLTIENPLPGAIVRPGSPLMINVQATDNDAIAYVLFSVNGKKVALDEVIPYVFETSASRMPESVQEITVSAYDRAGNAAHASVRFLTGR